MEMHQIRYFLAVCDCLNFTRAAETCNVTQPALTRAVQKLEEELGGLLFRRERKYTHMTDLGHLVRPQLEAILAQSESAKSTAKSFLQLKDAPLKLGVMCTIGPMRFIGFLATFGRDHPGIEVSLMESVPQRLAESLMAGELDVAIMTQPAEAHDRLDLHPLYEERFMIACAPGHRFEQMDQVPMADVAGEAYLTRANCEYIGYLDGILAERMIKVQDVYQSEREDWIQSMVLAGMGICFIPEYTPVIPGIVTRPIVEPEVTRAIHIVTVAGRRFSPAVATFVKAVDKFKWPPLSAVPQAGAQRSKLLAAS
jgi:LysR family transcriptional regulator, hydrogen peroxide-inducible genes activator